MSSKLRRISDAMAFEAGRLYRALGLDVEPNWYLVLLLLKDGAPRSITQIATILGISHPAVNEMVGNMSRRGLVRSAPDASDKRRRLITLSAYGVATSTRLAPVLAAAHSGIDGLLREAAPEALAVLDALEAGLTRQGFQARTEAALAPPAPAPTGPPPSAAVRAATPEDWPGIWRVFALELRSGEAYAYPPELPEPAARALWLAPGVEVLVACRDLRVVGAAWLRANQPGRGAHVANAGFVVDPAERGRGVGELLGHQALAAARRSGYRAMQFNFVVSSNTGAVRLWKRLGFAVVGTVPQAFEHPRLGATDVHIMYRRL